MASILQEPWFHGHISQRETDILLRLESQGTFLVRFSDNTKHHYVFAYVLEGKVVQLPITTTISGEKRTYQVADNPVVFESFSDISILVHLLETNVIAQSFTMTHWPLFHTRRLFCNNHGFKETSLQRKLLIYFKYTTQAPSLLDYQVHPSDELLC
jgi:hypothetical protein